MMLTIIQIMQGTMIRKARTQIRAKIPVERPPFGSSTVTLPSLLLNLEVSTASFASVVAALSSLEI